MNFIIFGSLLLLFSTAAPTFHPWKLSYQKKSMFIGSYKKLDENSPDVEKMAELAVEKVADADSDCTFKVERVLDARTRLAAGRLYTMRLEICPETCKKDVVKKSDCKICTAVALEKSWLKVFRVLRFHCPKSKISENGEKEPDVNRTNNVLSVEKV